MNHQVALDGHGSLEFEIKEGIIYLNGHLITRRTMNLIHEASHLAIVTSDIQLAELRRNARASALAQAAENSHQAT